MSDPIVPFRRRPPRGLPPTLAPKACEHCGATNPPEFRACSACRRPFAHAFGRPADPGRGRGRRAALRTGRLLGAGLAVGLAGTLGAGLLVTGRLGLPSLPAFPAPTGAVAALEGTPAPTPAPTAAPTPRVTPSAAPAAYAGRLEGPWLVAWTPDDAAAAAGLAPGEVLVDLAPACADGPCTTAASFVEPRGGAVLAIAEASPVTGYRLTATATTTGLCRGARGLTVDGGARLTATLVLRAVVPSPGAAPVLEGTRTVELVPTPVGTSAGCVAATAELPVAARALTAAERAAPEALLSPVALPDLIALPDVPAKIPGVKLAVFSVRGERASVLLRAWEAGIAASQCGGSEANRWACLVTDVAYATATETDAATGACTVTSLRPTLRMTMPIASWTSPALVPRELAAWWGRAVAAVVEREAAHAAINRSRLAVLVERAAGVPCAEVTALVNAWSDELAAAHEAYDAARPLALPPPPAAFR